MVLLRAHLPAVVLSRVATILLLLAVLDFVGVASAPGATRYFAIPTQPAAVDPDLLVDRPRLERAIDRSAPPMKRRVAAFHSRGLAPSRR
jgi:hypothetical protein